MDHKIMKKGIVAKLLPVLILLILILSGIFVFLIHQVVTSNFETVILEKIQESKNTFDSLMEEELRLLKASIISLSGNSGIEEAFALKNRDLLYSRTKDIYEKAKEEVGLTHWNFHTADDVLLLRVHSPELYGEKSSDRYTAKMAMDSTSWGYGLEVGSRGYALRMVGPYYRSGELIGYVEQGVEITPFLEVMKKQTGDDYAIFGLKKAFDPKKWKESRESKNLRNNYDDMADYVLLGSTATDFVETNIQQFSVQALNEASTTGNLFSTITSDGASYTTGGFTLLDGKGEKIGVVVVIHDVTEQIQEIQQTLLSLILIAFVITLIIAVLLIARIHSVIIKPLQKLTDAASAMGEGAIITDLVVTQDDEIGSLARSFKTLGDGLHGKGVAAAAIAKGNFDIEIPVLSERDVLGQTMTEMKEAIMTLTENVERMAVSAKNGILTERQDPEKFSGTYRSIIIAMNNMLEAIVIPLQEALRVADHFAHAEFSSRFDETVEVKGDLIALRDGLNAVGTELSQVISDVSDQVREMTASTEQAVASVEEVSAGAASIAQNSAQVSSNAERTVDSVADVMSDMGEFTSSVTMVASKVDDVSRLSQDVNDISGKGLVQANVAEEGIQAINGAVNDAGVIIEEFKTQAEEIGKIIEIISSIADQTNLLALNASIEAARAGDAGLGFAVVANEVKTLAQDSQRSADNISRIIEELQAQSEKAGAAMQKATDEVSRGSEAINETIRFFHTIAEQIQEISDNIAEVATLSEEERNAVQMIESRISGMKTLAEDTSVEASASAIASEESSVALNQISSIMAELSKIATRIDESMKRLKT